MQSTEKIGAIVYEKLLYTDARQHREMENNFFGRFVNDADKVHARENLEIGFCSIIRLSLMKE